MSSDIGYIEEIIRLKLSQSLPTKTMYGFRIDEHGKLAIGNSCVAFDKDNRLIIKNKKFKATNGLLALLLMDITNEYTKTDVLKYTEIIELTRDEQK